MAKTVVDHVYVNGKPARWCIRCGLHLDKDYNIDLDFYTARRYLALMQIPEEQRCKHERPDSPKTNEELLQMIDDKFHGGSFWEERADVLREIVKRLK